MTPADPSAADRRCKDMLLAIVDWFVPAPLQASTATLWRARHFVISHLIGPFSAVFILGYLYRAETEHDAVFFALVLLCSAFWLLPIALKFTGNLTIIALLSYCDLTFITVFGSFFYGGVSSPFLPWALCALLIGFFYLSERPGLVVLIFVGNLIGFCGAYFLHGEFPPRVPVPDLTTAGMISVLCATIYCSMMAIYYTYVMIEHSALRQEIENHLATAERLREAKQAAEQADRARAVFMARMNHQLRTPLNAIIGYSELLLDDLTPESTPTDRSDLRTINQAGQHLLSLVSEALYRPSEPVEMMEMPFQQFDLDRCLDVVLATCANLVTKNGNRLVLSKPSKLGAVCSDDTRFRQVLINLLSNAGKFTQNGVVVVRAAREPDRVVIDVEDNGIGIPEAAIETLFTKFNSANAATSSVYGGAGLGLSVCQELVRSLNGTIAVRSQSGHGSVFTVSLPVAATLPAAA